jgi:hypothetical protein
MLDRLMMGMVGPGVCVAAVFLLLSRHTAPACDADIVTSKPLPQLSAETGFTSSIREASAVGFWREHVDASSLRSRIWPAR